MTEWHAEILSDAQRIALSDIAVVLSARNFYLAGGTALALIFGHRRSIDLDWFTEAALDDPLALAADIADAGIAASVTTTARNTLYLDVHGVRVSAIRYRYPLLHPVIRLEEFSCNLASVEDIACMKLSAIVGRAEKKDYVDLATIAAHGYDLGTLVGMYQSKFGVDSVMPPLQALSYFDDADKDVSDIPALNKPGTWQKTKRILLQWVRSLPHDLSLER